MLETQPLVFEFFGRRCRSYPVWLADDDAHSSKWSRNDEPVPTFHPPATRILHIDRNDRSSGFLREKDNARSELISGTTRAVGRNQDIVSGTKNVAQLEEGGGTHS